MGRLPKGFRHGPTQQPSKEQQEQPSTSGAAPPMDEQPGASKPSGASKFLKEDPPPTASKVPANTADDVSGNEDSGAEEGASGPETRGQMIQRHKREVQAFKKNLPRIKKSKAEIAQLTAEMEARHAQELASLDKQQQAAAPAAPVAAGSGQTPGGDGAEEEEAEAAAGGGAGGGKHMTKAMKRRAKQAAEEAEREARIAAEAAAAGPSARVEEEAALAALLQPLGLKMRDIRADGHCLYRSVEDQLAQMSLLSTPGEEEASVAAPPAPSDYLGLRVAAAAHIRAHPEQYIHYIDVHDGETPEAALERHCVELEGTAAWGGQLELSVLAQIVKRPIRVLSAGLPPVTLGEDFKEAGPPLQVCYLRHAFGLGEHYNSLEPIEGTKAPVA